jgi:cytochrome c oxidase subunit 4
MADTNLTAAQHEHAESHVQTYLKVFLALLVFTVLEYFYAKFASRFQFHISLLILGLMMMAIIKAVLVAMYFMHLKFEGRWVYLMLVPAGILAAVFVVALTPDIALQPGAPPTSVEDEEAAVAPRAPASARAGAADGRPALATGFIPVPGSWYLPPLPSPGEGSATRTRCPSPEPSYR